MANSLVTLKHENENLARVEKEMKRLVRQRGAISAGASMLPIPGIDIALDVTSLTEMMNRINKEFGLTPDQIGQLHQAQREIVYREITNFGGVFVGKNITVQLLMMALKGVANRWIQAKAFRLLPIIGQGVAGGISFITFVKLGDAHIEECMEVRRRIAKRLLVGNAK